MAWETVRAEQIRRGTNLSETIGSLINEWRLLTRLQNAGAFRRKTYQDVAAARRGGREGAEALDRILGRLVLVTSM